MSEQAPCINPSDADAFAALVESAPEDGDSGSIHARPATRRFLRKCRVPMALVVAIVAAIAFVSIAVGSARSGLRGRESALTAEVALPNSSSVKLFCWSRMQPDMQQEVALVRLQFRMRVSIWQCDGTAIISTEKTKLGEIDGQPVYTWVNEAKPVEIGQMGKDGIEEVTTDSFLNTEVFLLAWDTLINSGTIWEHDFIVKVDPDAVFFPDRLVEHVGRWVDWVGKPIYVPNCGKWGGPVLLYGSLEVFSTEAMGLYKDRRDECKALPWHGWGEDYYMQHCMDHLGAIAVPDTQQVGDHRCVPAKCSDWTMVAFHDFKDPNDWYQCYEIATGHFVDEEVSWGRNLLD